ncbi:hypothetical protein J4460_03505 [Candidatus Woesearchaeota archaeon]|nr:hypothetical protein [Candidatus Woesearchaeota archaeon]HIH39017.1 hypothetical protein [Candidatus Woesearchaeota archaeon]HIH49235.1 hypothetical protein [Candidatus Woesearchaeota archaeon]HIJ03377.1 hypothetical protein [Candidatus Woesearchaeota archaeon]
MDEQFLSVSISMRKYDLDQSGSRKAPLGKQSLSDIKPNKLIDFLRSIGWGLFIGISFAMIVLLGAFHRFIRVDLITVFFVLTALVSLILAYRLDSEIHLTVALSLLFFGFISFIFTPLFFISFVFTHPHFFSLTLAFLGIATLFYGLSIYYRSISHKFSQVYFLCAMWLMLLIGHIILLIKDTIFTLSEYTLPGDMLSIILIALAFILTFGGLLAMHRALSRKPPLHRDCGWFILITILLVFFLFSTKILLLGAGSCTSISCSQYKNEEACYSAPARLDCEWGGDYYPCDKRHPNCNLLKNESTCVSVPNARCMWDSRAIVPNEPCNWDNGTCYTGACVRNRLSFCGNDFDPTKDTYRSDCDPSLCEWHPGHSDHLLTGSSFVLWMLGNLLFILFLIGALRYAHYIGDSSLLIPIVALFLIETFLRIIGFLLSDPHALDIFQLIRAIIIIVALAQSKKSRQI